MRRHIITSNTLGHSSEQRGPFTLVAAPVTPFLANGDLDVSGVRVLFEYLDQCGVGSIFAPGTTGEFTALEDDERLTIVRTAVEVLGPSRVIAHVGASSTRQAVRHSRGAHDVGARRFAAITPYFYAAGIASIADYYSSIVEATRGSEVFAYLFEARTHVNVAPNVLRDLATTSGIRGAKISGLPLDQVLQYVDTAPVGFAVYAGNDSDAHSLRTAGVCGLVSGVAQVFPAILTKALSFAGDGRDPEGEQGSLETAVRAVGGGNIALLKHGLNRLGLPAGPLRVAIDPPTPGEIAFLDRVLRMEG